MNATSAETAGTLTGLEFLHRVASGLIAPAPVADFLGLRSTYVMPGRVVVEYEPRGEHYGPLGAVDAGILTAALDSAMGAAARSLLDAGTSLASVELRTSFVRPVTLAVGKLRAEGVSVHAGSRLATSDARLVDAAGTLYASASSTALVLRNGHATTLAA